MLFLWRVLLGLETEDDMSKPVSLLYDPIIAWERAMSLALSIDSIHSSAEVLEESPVVTDVFVSSKV